MSGGGWSGGSFGDTATCVLAPNADVMTLDGTNTWVLRDPDSSRAVVVDPGPSIDAHLDAIDAAAARPPVEIFMPEVEGAGDSASLSIPERLRTLVEQRLS
jgi:hypothetical protein